ncbi:Hypothetical predicted protein [Octopus vulgaris]|uniref:Uncharacterized protein n=1 Tax=Octopus vulgaris TaxID=6645 RepID=A0AA36B9L4_OCTVU|nr:Hypothetical predicted protein [Octopus vulgaris]
MKCLTVSTLGFLEYHLSPQKQQRNDYRELLELTMIFLGSIPKNRILFRTPGADIDPEISMAAAKKFSIHLWYLAPETVGLSILDDNVPTKVKATIAQIMPEADKGEEEEEEKIS